MKRKTSLILTISLGTAAALSPLYFSSAEEKPTGSKEQPAKPVPIEDIEKLLLIHPQGSTLLAPPAPVIPEGTKMTEEVKKALVVINQKLVDPVRSYSSQRVLMSRIPVRMTQQYHIALTDTSDSLISFDFYTSHARGGWQKLASGVCHPGMESVKVAMPETGVMVDPIKHPQFTAAMMIHKRKLESKAS